MKFHIFFAVVFATVSDLYSLSIEDPVLENDSRITNGQTAAPGQFKYMIGLNIYINNKPEETKFCGGSLIDPEWVLSAAHCTNGGDGGTVYLGSTKRRTGGIVHNVTKSDILTHPAYDPSNNKADIGLIRIPQTSRSRTIGFVKLPGKRDNNYLNASVVITGWGRTSDNDIGLSDDLLFGIVKVVPGERCNAAYGLLFNDDSKICVATPEGVSSCKGDSGGPLVLEGKNRQIGVFSLFHTAGCAKKIPLVFARVSSYRLWILVRTGIQY